MKNTHPHTGKWLREKLPEQTGAIPSPLVWTVVYLADTVGVFRAETAVRNRIFANYRKN